MPKRKLMLAYICLVGAPLLALVGIVRAGQHLRPPISLGGEWNLDADFGSWPSGPCRELLASVNRPFFSVSQSGSELAVTLNNPQKTVLAGKLRGTSLTIGAEGPHKSRPTLAACGNTEAVRLIARVTGQARQRALEGTLDLEGCSNCPPLAFRATRRASPGSGGR